VEGKFQELLNQLLKVLTFGLPRVSATCYEEKWRHECIEQPSGKSQVKKMAEL